MPSAVTQRNERPGATTTGVERFVERARARSPRVCHPLKANHGELLEDADPSGPEAQKGMATS